MSELVRCRSRNGWSAIQCSSSSSSRTYRLTWHKLNTIASRTWYTNYREKNWTDGKDLGNKNVSHNCIQLFRAFGGRLSPIECKCHWHATNVKFSFLMTWLPSWRVLHCYVAHLSSAEISMSMWKTQNKVENKVHIYNTYTHTYIHKIFNKTIWQNAIVTNTLNS